MCSIESEASHTTILPCRYVQRSRWWQCSVPRRFLGNAIVVDELDLSSLLGLVNLQISNLHRHCFTILLPQALLNVDFELHLRYWLLLTLLLACFIRCGDGSMASASGAGRSGDPG